MHAISQLLQDPNWWFAAVIIAVLASVAASWLRDLISWAAACVSQDWSHRRAKRIAWKIQTVDYLKQHPEVLTMRLVRSAIMASFWCCGLVLYLFVPVLIDVVKRNSLLGEYNVSAQWRYYWIPHGMLSAVLIFMGARINISLDLPIRAFKEHSLQCREKILASTKMPSANETSREAAVVDVR